MGFTQELQESIMSAIQSASKKEVMNSNATCTLQCEVVEVTDPGKNEYKVKIQNNIIIAYGTPSVTYKPGNLVQVLFPNGNDQSDQDAIIVGAVTYSTELYTENGNDNYINISENLINGLNEIDLYTYNSSEQSIELTNDNFGSIFLDYLKDYQVWKLSASIKTDIQPMDQRAAGDYGIVLKLPILKDNGNNNSSHDQFDIKINVDNIQGNPYNLSSYTNQEIYVEVPADLVQDPTDENGNKRYPIFTAFVTGFAQGPQSDKKDIFLKDFSFQAVDAYTEKVKSGYYLTIVSDTGRYYVGSEETKTLRPVLKVNGKNKKLNDYDCYWFRENTTITPGNSKYSSYGKSGQECLNDYNSLGENEDGTESIQQVTDNYEYNVSQDSIYTSMKFKCVLVDKEGAVVAEGYIVLTNKSTDSVEFNLKTTTGFTSYTKNVGNVSLVASIKPNNIIVNDLISTTQQRFDKNGNAIDTDFYNVVRSNDKNEDWIEFEINFPCSFINEQNTIKCSFQREFTKSTGEVKKELIGSSEILINTQGNYTYRVVIENGNYLYKYDGNGNSPFVADYSGPVSSRVKTIPTLSQKMYKADGTELTEDEYKYCKCTQVAPANRQEQKTTTMFDFYDGDKQNEREGYYHINKNQLDYKIANRYNDKTFVNDITLVIEYNGATIEETTDIRFLKEGESGTNGSKYTGLILQNGCTYGEYEGYLHKFQLIYNNGANPGQYWVNRANEEGSIEKFIETEFTVQIYCNGESINNDDDNNDSYIQNITQSLFNERQANPMIEIDNNGKVTIKEGVTQDGIKDTINIIQVKVEVGPLAGEISNPQEVLYIYYPIEISYITNKLYNKSIPNIGGGFDKVLYASNDGTNPQYNNVDYFEYINNIDDEEYNSYNSYTQDVIGNLEFKNFYPTPTEDNPKKVDESRIKVDALTTKESAFNFNYVKVTMTNNQTIENIRTKIDATQGKITDNNENIKTKNSIETNIINLKNYWLNIKDNNIENSLRSSKEFVNTRANMLNALNDALTDLYTFNEEFKKIFPSGNENIFNYEATKEEIENKKNELRVLGKKDTPAELPSINKLSTITFNAQQIPKKIAYDLNMLIDAYNEDIERFNDNRNIFNDFNVKASYYGQKSFKGGMYEYCNNNSQSDSLKERPEYLKLQNTLNQLLLNLSNDNDEALIYTYSDIKDKVFDEFDKLIEQYMDASALAPIDKEKSDLEEANVALNSELNSYKKELDIAEHSSSVVHLKPIIVTMNTHSMSYLNDQDGNKLYTGGTDGEYLFAPQVGAGKKESDGSFTGITIGVKATDKSPNEKQIGLFGLSKGEQSIFLSAEDGHAEFGKSGRGQIKILPNDPTNNMAAIIEGGNYSTSKKEGMQIDLSEPTIKFGSGNFEVSKEGQIKAKGGGSIASQTIGDNILSSAGVELNSLESSVQVKTAEGKIYSGSHSAINNPSVGFQLSNNGLSIGSKFKATDTGTVQVGTGAYNASSETATNNKCQAINGNTDGSYISFKTNKAYFKYDTLDKKNLIGIETEASAGHANSGEVYIGTDGIRLGKEFGVDSNGRLFGSSVTVTGTVIANKGSIGDQDIDGGKIVGKASNNGGKITLNAKGSIIAEKGKAIKQEIDRDGSVTFTNGTIAGQTLNEASEGTLASLTAGNMTLRSDGYIGGGSNYGQSITNAGNATFNNITATGTINATGGYLGKSTMNPITSDGLAFNSGSVSLTSSSGAYTGDKISFSNSGGLVIQGDITARNGTFTGTIKAKSGYIGGESSGQSIETGLLKGIDNQVILNSNGTISVKAINCYGTISAGGQDLKIGTINATILKTGDDLHGYTSIFDKLVSYGTSHSCSVTKDSGGNIIAITINA